MLWHFSHQKMTYTLEHALTSSTQRTWQKRCCMTSKARLEKVMQLWPVSLGTLALEAFRKSPTTWKLPCWRDHKKKSHRDKKRYLGAPAFWPRLFESSQLKLSHTCKWESFPDDSSLSHHPTVNSWAIPSKDDEVARAQWNPRAMRDNNK